MRKNDERNDNDSATVRQATALQLITQIGGRYTDANEKLFKLKDALERANVTVRHPIGTKIQRLPDGQLVAFDPVTEERNFYQIELDYYENIRQNPMHFVANYECDNAGMLGYSSSLEIAYAMLFRKQIACTDKVVFGETVEPLISRVLSRNLGCLQILPGDWNRPGQMELVVKEFAASRRETKITPEEASHIEKLVEQLLSNLRSKYNSI